MDQKTFESLSKGDKVVYTTPNPRWAGNHQPNVGSILTRRPEWMDDQGSRAFDFTDKDGKVDFHYFAASEIELIEEQQ